MQSECTAGEWRDVSRHNSTHEPILTNTHSTSHNVLTCRLSVSESRPLLVLFFTPSSTLALPPTQSLNSAHRVWNFPHRILHPPQLPAPSAMAMPRIALAFSVPALPFLFLLLLLAVPLPLGLGVAGAGVPKGGWGSPSIPVSGVIIPGFASSRLRAWALLDCPYSPLDFRPLDPVWLDTKKVGAPPFLSPPFCLTFGNRPTLISFFSSHLSSCTPAAETPFCSFLGLSSI